jgi:hypothetical protein
VVVCFKERRNLKQLKNRLHSENADLQEGVRLNPKFEEMIEEIIDSCKAIRQILHEAEQAVSTNAGFFFRGQPSRESQEQCEAGFAFRPEN